MLLRRQSLVATAAVAIMMIGLIGCSKAPQNAQQAAPQGGTQPATQAAPKPAISIGSKNFTEELLLGEMYADLLEAHGYKVNRKLNIAGTAGPHEALVKGDIDMYPEYTGTGLLDILKLPVEHDSQKVYDTVKAGYLKNWNLVWLDQAPMNDTQAIAVTQATSQKYNMTTLSQMSTLAPKLVMGGVQGFTDRPDGLKGLKQVYGGFDFKEVKLLDFGIKYKALLDGQVDTTVAFGTDGAIKGNNLVVLKDDKNLWPPYHVAPIVRKQLLDQAPDVATILNPLAPLLTDETMQTLNWEVDGQKKEYADVAHDFLLQHGLIKK